ncbi:uncharacterized protein DUF4386 [Mumia flava]|uniref:Uncharacterized protein DUF4386 n=1 Tax=Mumia flava TaxID=1348852 RepID=A0A0B2BLG3_9ACTN|nr:DUF4386 domain-containing protein [Mumia flava]PJJ56412.1 uncharacterized protein DUF4386 [Mumia flava]
MTAVAAPARDLHAPDNGAPLRTSEGARRRLARFTGALYLLLAVLGMLGPLTLESLLVPGDAVATADGLAQSQGLFGLSLGAWIGITVIDVVVSVTLLAVLAPLGAVRALLSSVFRLVYTVMMAAGLVHLFAAYGVVAGTAATPGSDAEVLASLETFSTGFLVALVLFGVHLVLLGELLLRSRAVPRVLGGLLVVAGIGYVVDSLASLLAPSYGGVLPVVLLTPAVVGEVGLALWLLVRGVAPLRTSLRAA